MTPVQSSVSLLNRALEVWLRSLRSNERMLPCSFRSASRVLRRFFVHHPLTVRICPGAGTEPTEAAEVRFIRGSFHAVATDLGRASGRHGWTVSRDYLERVVRDEATLLSDPLSIDWSWMDSHVRLSCGGRPAQTS